ncbi:hypothetical protein P886_1521 [Alteromonadaceae bacterium 2753L.S.0a.02]|nr:hypothetical protein P886_1521 [Alteromonadaceae bacterium 2753L.S.0a.02]
MRTLILAAGTLLSLSTGLAHAETVELSVPHTSDDGSYVLRVKSENSVSTMSRQGLSLEIFRNKDGGEFKRLLLGPGCSALSELVQENGVYGYKARWVSTAADNEKVASIESEFSSPVYISVASEVPRVIPARKDRLVSMGSLNMSSARTP